MSNPYLHDRVERICRDPLRKPGYGDRIFGTIMEALKQDIFPKTMALAAAAALRYAVRSGAFQEMLSGPAAPSSPTGFESQAGPDAGTIRSLLLAIWKNETLDQYKEQCISLVIQASPVRP